MLDFSNLEKYKENNRIEAKKALGGLPHSIWETYSAFANTLGGIILLGVEEFPDKSLHPVDLPDPDWLIGEFWDIINTPSKVSANILTDSHIAIHTVNGNHIIAITVPRAHRYDKPVYLDNDPFHGTYRRNGEGDYRCTREEVQAMLRDAAVKSPDMKLLEHMQPDVLDPDSIQRYRWRMELHAPEHVWRILDNPEFLYKLGAVGFSKDGILHPTAAGLLMFGRTETIQQEFPHYNLSYCGPHPTLPGQNYILSSQQSDWSGNVFDFYVRVAQALVNSIPAGQYAEEASLPDALREALANALFHADYYAPHGLEILRKPQSITLSNPGSLRVKQTDIFHGGTSDPRNEVLARMFRLVGVGQRSMGLAGICHVWEKQGWQNPVLTENFDPERISLVLSLEWSGEDTGLPPPPSCSPRVAAHREAIAAYLTVQVSASCSELAEMLDLHPSRVRKILRDMRADGIITAHENGRNRVYQLKA